MIYLDSSAAVKMIRSETGSAELVTWLNARSRMSLVSSALVEIEVPRALRRSAPEGLAGVPSVLSKLYRLEIDATIRATAAAYTVPYLRSLDAIHLATAQLLQRTLDGDLEAFVAYDQRLVEAAEAIGLDAVSPGG